MDDHRSSIGKFGLFHVYLSEEAEDAAGLLRYAVVWPAHVLVVPHSPTLLWLHGRNENGVRNMLFFPELHTDMFVGYRVNAGDLQNSDFVICSVHVRLAGHHIHTRLLGATEIWPIGEAFILCQEKKRIVKVN